MVHVSIHPLYWLHKLYHSSYSIYSINKAFYFKINVFLFTMLQWTVDQMEVGNKLSCNTNMTNDMTNHPPKVSECVTNLWTSVTWGKIWSLSTKHEISNAINGIEMKHYLKKVKIQTIAVAMSATKLIQILDAMARRYYILQYHFVQCLLYVSSKCE